MLSRRIDKLPKRYAAVVRGLLGLLLGGLVGAALYHMLHNEVVHEFVSEQVTLTEARIWIIVTIVALAILLHAAAWIGRAAAWLLLAYALAHAVAVLARRDWAGGIRAANRAMMGITT